jgi:hypothetical protein
MPRICASKMSPQLHHSVVTLAYGRRRASVDALINPD